LHVLPLTKGTTRTSHCSDCTVRRSVCCLEGTFRGRWKYSTSDETLTLRNTALNNDHPSTCRLEERRTTLRRMQAVQPARGRNLQRPWSKMVIREDLTSELAIIQSKTYSGRRYQGVDDCRLSLCLNQKNHTSRLQQSIPTEPKSGPAYSLQIRPLQLSTL